MTALNLPGFDDGEPTLEVWDRSKSDWFSQWERVIKNIQPGWYWIDHSINPILDHGPFATRDLALADAKANGADTREENVV